MSSETDRPAPGRRRRAEQQRGSSRSWVRPTVVASVLVVGCVAAATGWLAWSGLKAKSHLEDARSSTQELRTSLLAQDAAQVDNAATLASLRSDASRARDLTNGPVWRAAAALPWAGDSVRAVSTTTSAIDDVAQGVLPALVEQVDALSPETLRVDGDRIDVQRIARAEPAIRAAGTEARRVADRVNAVDTADLPARLRTSVREVQDELDELATTTADAAEAARLLPTMLGAEGKRRYFLGFQTNAETRGSGGLIGAYGVLEANKGRLRVVRLGPRRELDPGNLRKPAVDFGAEYEAMYGDDSALWVNANVSPHFPHSAQLWLAMYEKQRGVRLDGAVATDPVALASLLGATGPVTLDDGRVVTEANAVRLTMSDIYTMFDQDVLRDDYLQVIARAVIANVLAGKGEPRAVLDSLDRSVQGRNLLLYSAHEDEQKVLETTKVGGSLAARPGPFVGVFMNSGSASKLDYYLDAEVDYSLEACRSGRTRGSTVTMRLRSTAPRSGLSFYVAGPRGPEGEISQLDLVSVHLPVGASVRAARLDGQVLTVAPQTLVGRPVVTFPVRIAAGQERTVVLELTEPRSALEPTLEVQALAKPARTSATSAVSCA